MSQSTCIAIKVNQVNLSINSILGNGILTRTHRLFFAYSFNPVTAFSPILCCYHEFDEIDDAEFDFNNIISVVPRERF